MIPLATLQGTSLRDRVAVVNYQCRINTEQRVSAEEAWDRQTILSRAIERGRGITRSLAYLVEQNRRGAYWVDMESVLRGGPILWASHDTSTVPEGKGGTPIEGLGGRWESPAKAIAHVWANHTPAYGPDHPTQFTD